MSEKKTTRRFKLGDRVKVRYSGYGPGRIIELWGPLGQGGMYAYRVRIPNKPHPILIDLEEDLLEPVPVEAANEDQGSGATKAGAVDAQDRSMDTPTGKEQE